MYPVYQIPLQASHKILYSWGNIMPNVTVTPTQQLIWYYITQLSINILVFPKPQIFELCKYASFSGGQINVILIPWLFII